jgi:uncharacterized SAM-binding protein YcdF (DUF218 family)
MLDYESDKYHGHRSTPWLTRRAFVPALFTAVFFLAMFCWYLLSPSSPYETGGYDCIVVPGGGLVNGEPAAWVAARLDAALRHDDHTQFYLVLSRGTTHKPPPLDGGDFPIDESAASARYLVARGVEPSRVLLESWSLDTIGNAAFARLMHSDLRGWHRLLVVTSELHMARTRTIFEWIFALPEAAGRGHSGLHMRRRHVVELSFESVPEGTTMDAAQAASRQEKEEQALRSLREGTIPAISDLGELHAFLFQRHGAYRAMSKEDEEARERERAQGHLARTY